MTTTPSLAEVIALSQKATQGEFRVGQIDDDGARIDTDEFEQVAYLWQRTHRFAAGDGKVATGPEFGSDKPQSNAAFIAALVNWFRTSAASLRDEDARDAELFRYMEKYAAGWYNDDCQLPRIVIKPYFHTNDGGVGALLVTGHDGVGTCTLRTALRIMQNAATQPAAQERQA